MGRARVTGGLAVWITFGRGAEMGWKSPNGIIPAEFGGVCHVGRGARCALSCARVRVFCVRSVPGADEFGGNLLMGWWLWQAMAGGVLSRCFS
jgi:hypothetical protein